MISFDLTIARETTRLQLAQMTICVNIMPNLNGPLVVALLYDGLATFEFGIVVEVFGLSRPELGDDWYRFASEAIEPGPLRAHGDFQIVTTGDVGLIEQADLIVVPGWKGLSIEVPSTLIERLRSAHTRGARIASICSGAFVLAATGLLDGKTATTHWRYAEALSQKFPAVTVDAASLYRGEDRVFTSAGSAAGIDLLIELVRQDFGPDHANSVARRMVMPAHRNGGQAQFVQRPVPKRTALPIAPLLDRVRDELHRPWTIHQLASEAKMSKRTFERRFADATGASPGEWLAAERVEAAKYLLTTTDLPMEHISDAVGLGSAHALRHHFRKQMKLTPTEYRQRFAV
ncbi:transcriptional regulator FtrA [Erythrobacter aureus]|uniref:transcriptional regulator FtrA n=1 Tax=Erythrobacter aureus TaxID=2182384 RepID=UPI003A9433B5